MKLTKGNFDYDEDCDILEIDITEDMNITGEDFYNSIRDQILKNQEIIIRLGKLLELLVYPYLIESNTVKNILEVISGLKIGDLSKYNTRDILFISSKLKQGIVSIQTLQKILDVEE